MSENASHAAVAASVASDLRSQFAQSTKPAGMGLVQEAFSGVTADEKKLLIH